MSKRVEKFGVLTAFGHRRHCRKLNGTHGQAEIAAMEGGFPNNLTALPE
jgi:hypothetical protein